MATEMHGTKKKYRYSYKYYAAHPTKNTMFWRKFWPWQAWRFVALNVKILKIVLKGHS